MTPGDFTQALIELRRARLPAKGSPLCENCPVSAWCGAYKEHLTDKLPYRSPKAKRRVEKKTVLLLRDGGRYAVRRRPAEGLLAGLYEFPCADGALDEKEALSYVASLDAEPLFITPLAPAKHIFTHIEWHMTAYEIRVAPYEGKDLIFASADELAKNIRFLRLSPPTKS